MLVAAACSNSKAKVVDLDHDRRGRQTRPPGRPRPESTSRSIAPGVTDTEIRVGGVASVTNPLGGKYGDAFAGTKAYFDMVNASGGIYGRKLVLAAQRDDKTANNKVEVQGLLTQDHVFAVLPVATLLFTGAQTLVDQAIPTFGWTINPEWEGSAKDPRSNLFGQAGSYLCFDCAAPALPWLAKRIGAHKVGVLAYTVSESADVRRRREEQLQQVRRQRPTPRSRSSTSRSPSESADLSVQVSKMKKAGVDLVTTCMDTNGVVTLAKEMKKQQLKAVQYLPNAYDHELPRRVRRPVRRLLRAHRLRAVRVPKDKPKGLKTYLAAMDKAGRRRRRRTRLVGWINADLFVDRPPRSRADVQSPEGHRRDQQDDGLHAPTGSSTASTGPRSTRRLKKPGEACQFLSKIQDSKFDPALSQARQAVRLRGRQGRQARHPV